MTKTLALVLLLTGWRPALAAGEGVLPAAAKDVKVSSAPAAALQTLKGVYHYEGLRDPFLTPGAGAVVQKDWQTVEFSIHNLVLKGILADPAGNFAVLVDGASGASYILKNGYLYNPRKKLVPGVTGVVQPKQKTVHLVTTDKDVQTLILGEDTRSREGL